MPARKGIIIDDYHHHSCQSVFDTWLQDYQACLLQESQESESPSAARKEKNPKYILKNYMADIAILKASQNQDYSEIERLLA